MKLFLRHADLLATYAWLTVLGWWLREGSPWWVWVAFVAYGLIMTAKDVVKYFIRPRVDRIVFHTCSHTGLVHVFINLEDPEL